MDSVFSVLWFLVSGLLRGFRFFVFRLLVLFVVLVLLTFCLWVWEFFTLPKVLAFVVFNAGCLVLLGMLTWV